MISVTEISLGTAPTLLMGYGTLCLYLYVGRDRYDVRTMGNVRWMYGRGPQQTKSRIRPCAE